jgi:hypothetical protein
MGTRLRGEETRALLGALVLAVAASLLWDLLRVPETLFTVGPALVKPRPVKPRPVSHSSLSSSSPPPRPPPSPTPSSPAFPPTASASPPPSPARA